MNKLFEITTPENHIRLDGSRAGSATFTLANLSGHALRARITVTAEPPIAQPWLSISGASERIIDAGAVVAVDVQIAAPTSAAPGRYVFSVGAADTDRPDDTFSESPSVSFDVAEVRPPKINPLLIIVPVIVVVAIVLAIALLSSRGPSNAELTQTAIAAELTAAPPLTQAAAQTNTRVAEIATQTAVAQLTSAAAQTNTRAAEIATQTAIPQLTNAAAQTNTRVAELATQTAIAGNIIQLTQQAAATQTQSAVLNSFVDTWAPTGAGSPLGSVTVTRSGNALTVSYLGCQPPDTPNPTCVNPAVRRTTTNVVVSNGTLTATDNFNVIVMSFENGALRLGFRGRVDTFAPLSSFPTATFPPPPPPTRPGGGTFLPP